MPPCSPEPPLLGRARAEAEQLANHLRKVLLEGGVVLGVVLHPLAEVAVLDEHNVGWEHHQLPGGVLKLHGPRPRLALVGRLDGPDVLQELAVVLGADGRRGPRPRPPVARAVNVTGAQAVRAAEADDLLVVEAHPAENVAEVLRCLVGAARVGAWQAAVLVRGPLPCGAVLAAGLVHTAGREGHFLPAHLLDCNAGRVDPEVCVGDLRELLLHGLEQVLRDLQAGVRAPRDLRLEAHGGTAGTARLRALAVGARGVPREADEERPGVGPRVG
mmetsp:Transcript_1318/g.3576  ORF Transcript_1318/g.3576 Transcript_1318/m.3576 type:complete len:273 (-) Transcript_1318:366-1184(-)